MTVGLQPAMYGWCVLLTSPSLNIHLFQIWFLIFVHLKNERRYLSQLFSSSSGGVCAGIPVHIMNDLFGGYFAQLVCGELLICSICNRSFIEIQCATFLMLQHIHPHTSRTLRERTPTSNLFIHRPPLGACDIQCRKSGNPCPKTLLDF